MLLSMTDEQSTLTGKEFQLAGGVEDWRVLGSGASAWFDAPSHRAGATLIRKVAELAEGAGDALPDMDLRARGIRVRITPGEGGLSRADVTLARSISGEVGDLGLRPHPAALQDVQLTIDAMEQASVMPFWQAALRYEPFGDDDLVDPMRRHPPIWFQQQDQPRPLRNRLHVDVVSPQPLAVDAVTAARAGGARAVTDHGYYATVADAEGNEADLLPLQDGADRWGGQETEDWRVVFAAMACYPTASTRQAVELAEAVAGLADEAGLPLGIDVRPDVVTIDTGKDNWEEVVGYEPLAARAQEAARAMQLTADVSRLRFVQVGIDAVDIAAVRGFWQAVLGYEEDPRSMVTDIVDPRQLSMPFFFQDMDASDEERRAQRNRIHVDVFVPDDQAQARIDAGLAAGGRVVYDGEAPEWWTLADPEGNEVDIAVSVGREEIWRAATPS